MAITYKVVKVKNPKGADGVDFYAGRAVKTSDYSFDELMEDIESSTTVTEADAAAPGRPTPGPPCEGGGTLQKKTTS